MRICMPDDPPPTRDNAKLTAKGRNVTSFIMKSRLKTFIEEQSRAKRLEDEEPRSFRYDSGSAAPSRRRENTGYSKEVGIIELG